MARAATFVLGTTNVLTGPSATSNSVLLAVSPAGSDWTAEANVSWLHPAFTNGSVSTNMFFRCDANTGTTRSGTLTIAGQTLFVTQAGASFVPATMLGTLVSADLNSPSGVAVDAGGNVSIADTGNNAIEIWKPASNAMDTLVSSGLSHPVGVAVDGSGHVYIGDEGNNAVRKWDAASSNMTTLVSSELNGPRGVAVDAGGNVFIADTSNNAVKMWDATSNRVSAVFSASLVSGVAVDAAGDVYATQTGDGQIIKRFGTAGLTHTVASGLGAPYGIAVDGAGNLFISDTNSGTIQLWNAVSNQVVTLVASGVAAPRGVAVDGAGNLYVADAGANAIKKRPFAFVDASAKTVAWNAVSDTLSAVLPATQDLSGPFAPASDQWWLGITGVTNGVVHFNLATNWSIASRVANITLLGQPVAIVQAGMPSVSATDLLEPSAAGADSVSILTDSAAYAWTATTDSDWLRLATTNGTGSSTVFFTFNANTGAVRSCSISIAGLTVRVTQRETNASGACVSTLAASGVGTAHATLSGCVNPGASPAAGFFQFSTNGGWLMSQVAANVGAGCSSGGALAVGRSNDFFVAAPDCIGPLNWITADGAVKILITNNTGIRPRHMVLDDDGNLYVADLWCIRKYTMATGTWSVWAGDPTVTQQTVDGYGLAARFWRAMGLARNRAGTVFYVGEVNRLRSITTSNILVSSLTDQGTSVGHRDGPAFGASDVVALVDTLVAVAADDFGNLYAAEYMKGCIRKYHFSTPAMVTTLAGDGITQGFADGVGRAARFQYPSSMVVDRSGILYVADPVNGRIRKVTPDGVVSSLVFRDATNGNPVSLACPNAVAIDGEGTLYATDFTTDTLRRIRHGLAEPVTTVAGQSGLTGTNGLIISNTVCGLLPGTTYFYRAVTTNSAGTNYGDILSFTTFRAVLTTTHFVEGPAAGTNSLVLGMDPGMVWTAAANVPWLHPMTTNGTGSTNILFSFDANPGPARTGILSIAGETVTVVQAGSTYGQVEQLGTLLSTGLSSPNGLAVDAAGNLYVADTANHAVKKWNLSDGSVSTLISSGLNSPRAVALDALGNVYVTDTGNGLIKKWDATSGAVSILVSSGISSPWGIAVDGRGNVYYSDTGADTLQKWSAADGVISTLVSSGLNDPKGIAVDAAGSLYIADSGGNAVRKWNAAGSNVTTLVSSDSGQPVAVAVDGSGNVFIADTGSGSVKVWNAITGTVSTRISGLNDLSGVAVDDWGRVITVEAGGNTIKESPRAFVDLNPKTEYPFAGSDLLSAVLPPLGNLARTYPPSSDQGWLTLTEITNGVVGFAFAHNPGLARTAGISLLGLGIAVNQSGDLLVATNFVEGPAAGTNALILAGGNGMPWSASSDASWLHIAASGCVDGTNILFFFDANAGATRVGTLTIAGKTITVTQAGAAYTSRDVLLTLATNLTGLAGAAVDGAGNLYFADKTAGAIRKWNAADSTVSTLVSAGLNQPGGVALDGAGNVYIADTGNNAIKKWDATSNLVFTVLSTGLNSPNGVAVDVWGNVYVADSGNNALKKCSLASGGVTVLAASGLNNPIAVAVDLAGNVYVADHGNNAIKKWDRESGTMSVVTTVYIPSSVAVDGSGHLYFTDPFLNTVKKWNAVSHTVNTMASGLSSPAGVAVDASGSVYVANTGNGTIKVIPRAFIDTTSKTEPPCAGSDLLPAVVPSWQNLRGPLAPTSSQPWLTISETADGVVHFSFTDNSTASRTARITLLGRAISVTQTGVILGLGDLVEGPSAGSNSVTLAVGAGTAWTATANATWLHFPAGNGNGSTNVLFTFGANTGATRAGTLTLAGQKVNVTQAGTNFSAANPLITLVSLGSDTAGAMAMDATGNIYIADPTNNVVMKWNVANGSLSALVSAGLNRPSGVAVDGLGNVYVADAGNNAIQRCNAADGEWTTLVSAGLNSPGGVAVDGSDNVFIADTGNQAVKKWNHVDGTLTTLWSSGSCLPTGVVLDVAGNAYVVDRSNNLVLKIDAISGAVTTLASAGLSGPCGVAVDGSGHVFVADTGNNAVKRISALNGAVTTVAASGLNAPEGLVVDGWGNVFIADTGNRALKEVPRAFVDATPRTEPAWAGSDTVPVVPARQNLSGPFAPVSERSWLTITSATNGVVGFDFSANPSISNRTANITLLGRDVPVTQGSAFTLSITSLLEGPAAGSDGVMLASTSPSNTWTATAMDGWLHVIATNGTGGGSVCFAFDANTGATRTGIVVIADCAVTVVQAGAAYVPASQVTLVSTGMNYPRGLAVDGAGNVLVADGSTGNAGTIKKWNASSRVLTNLVSAGLSLPWGIAADAGGNVVFSEGHFVMGSYGAIKRWIVTNNNVATLSLSGLSFPGGIAFDRSGSLLIADAGNNAIRRMSMTSNTLATVISSGLNSPRAVAVDFAGNIYIADTGNHAIKKWNVDGSNVTMLVSTGLRNPSGVAVDLSGNVYIADTGNHAVKKWNVADNTVTTLLSSNLSGPCSVALDGAGSLFITDCDNPFSGTRSVLELPRAFVSLTPRIEPITSGTDALPAVLPSTFALTGALAPASDTAWLAISGVTDGVVDFSFTANTHCRPRTGHVLLLGREVAILQNASPDNILALGMTNRVEGPAAGTDSVVLAIGAGTAWTATSDAPWLHPSTDGGTGATNVLFSFDANPGATRTGALTLAGQTLTVIQAGATYGAVDLVTNLPSAELNTPNSVAVDGAGNVYIADTANNLIRKWNAADGVISTLISTGLNAPRGIAVDAFGNLYVANSGNHEVEKWSVASGSFSALVSTGLNSPRGMAVDAFGNVFIADSGNGAIRKWNAADSSVSTILSAGLSDPGGVAVDAAGNVYVADTGNGAIRKWNAAGGALTDLVSSGLSAPEGIAVDAAGNVFIADTGNGAIRKWSAVDGGVTTLLSTGLNSPRGVAVDGVGGLCIADTGNNAILVMPRAFVDATPRTEPSPAGNDTLPVVLPPSQNLAGPFTPASDQSWLAVDGVWHGIVNFSFQPGSGSIRTAHIRLLGRDIAITQSSVSLGATNIVEGSLAGADSVALAAAPATVWSATADAEWLHLPAASGTGSTNVVFTFDANPGPTRAGSLNIGGQTLTIIQAGVGYESASAVIALVTPSALCRSIAVDDVGNVLYSESWAVKKWNRTNCAAAPLFSLQSETRIPLTVAVDKSGDVYFTDIGATVPFLLRKWDAGSGLFFTLFTDGLSAAALKVAPGGDVIIADSNNKAVRKWSATDGSMTTLLSTNLASVNGVAVDIAGNIYVADRSTNAIWMWNAAGSNLASLVSSGLKGPGSVAVDGCGNVYLADTNSVKRWNASDRTVSTLATYGSNAMAGVAVDAARNVCFIDGKSNVIRTVTRAFVDATPRIEPADPGSGTLPPVLPPTQNLSGPYAPASDQPWLMITGVSNNVICYSFAANDGPERTAHIAVLGTTIPLTQCRMRTPVTVTLESSQNPSSFGAGVTFTATVSAADAGGLVTFRDGPAELGAVALSGSTASLATNGLGAGNHSLTAEYSGDSNYQEATNSPAFLQTVSKAAPDVMTWPAASDIVFGQPLSASALNGGTASVGGGFAWTTPAFMPPVGTTLQSVTFTPTDSDNYSNVVDSVSVTAAGYRGLIRILGMTDSTVTLQFQGASGNRYHVERAASLADPVVWTRLTTGGPLLAGPSGDLEFTDTNRPPSAAYYRSVQ